MNRIKKLFSEPKEKVIPFLTAGYPELDSTIEFRKLQNVDPVMRQLLF